MTKLLCLLLFASVLLTLPGCSGCRGETPEEKKAKASEKLRKEREALAKRKKTKPNVEEFGFVTVEPVAPDQDAKSRDEFVSREERERDERERKQREQDGRSEKNVEEAFAKPGHWVTIAHQMRANNRDFQGQFRWSMTRKPPESSRSGASNSGVLFPMAMQRPVSLAKQQKRPKPIDMTLFVPSAQESARVTCEVIRKDAGRERTLSLGKLKFMPAHEYYFVVLSSEPDRYGQLNSLHSIRPPRGGIFKQAYDTYYRVVLQPSDQPVALPTNPLTWTSIAYVLWDDIDPAKLSPQQQEAMIDWLHWGGQLIVSGPSSFDLLRGSFLDPWLPAMGDKTVKLVEDDLATFGDQWLAALSRSTGKPSGPTPLRIVKTWDAIELKLREGISEEAVLGKTTAGLPLVVERSVGRGRVVVSAFSLRQRELRAWSGFDSFFNACLLRRPPRVYQVKEGDEPYLNWSGLGDRSRDPRLVTRYRLFSRDAGYDFTPRKADDEFMDDDEVGGYPIGPEDTFDQFGQPLPQQETPKPELGIGVWSDNNPVSNSAREAIRESAGIEIPKASFVVWVLCGYLIVLVPVNWAVFRLIGRVELAWVAAPILSIICAVVVIRLAELDIGFARSKTEIAIIEMHGDYPRAHVTRYTALYTSLSTEYELEFENANALVQPFPMKQNSDGYLSRDAKVVDFHREDHVRLEGFHVDSNSTGVLHSEQMLDLGGTLSIASETPGKIRVKNGTSQNLSAVAVIRCEAAANSTKRFDWAWLGTIDSASVGSGAFESIAAGKIYDQWRESAPHNELLEQGEGVNVHAVVMNATAIRDMKPGDLRLIGISLGQELPGLSVDPPASQSRSVSLVVAHLRTGLVEKPLPDANRISAPKDL